MNCSSNRPPPRSRPRFGSRPVSRVRNPMNRGEGAALRARRFLFVSTPACGRSDAPFIFDFRCLSDLGGSTVCTF